MLHLVRHGPPVIEPVQPASSWQLDESKIAELERLRTHVDASARTAAWFTFDEPKAIATARSLTDGDVEVEPALREAARDDWYARHEDFRSAVLHAFERPSRPGRPGWEPLDHVRTRVSAAVAGIVGRTRTDVVLVGHGTAWTLLVSEITGTPPDVTSWLALRTPDLCSLDLETRTITRAWGDW